MDFGTNYIVYKILNTVNNKCYIGSAKNFVKRKNKHLKMLRHNNHPNRHLQSAWNKYGATVFEFEILEKCNPETLIAQEQFWMDNAKYQGIELYNIREKAESNLGFHHGGGFKKGSIPWNKGKTGLQISPMKGKMRPLFSGINHPNYKTHCPKGHERTSTNLTTSRGCKQCDNIRSAIRNKTEKQKKYKQLWYLTHKEEKSNGCY
jgi:group I intron endonuclease